MERNVEVREGETLEFVEMTEAEVETAGLDTSASWSRTADGGYAIEDSILDRIDEQYDGWDHLFAAHRVELYTVDYCNEVYGRYLAPQAAAVYERLARTGCPTVVTDADDNVVATSGRGETVSAMVAAQRFWDAAEEAVND